MSKEVFDKFESLKGAKFITINGYENSHGEISNQNINVNVNIEHANRHDLAILYGINVPRINEIADMFDVSADRVLDIITKMINRLEKNISNEERTASSKAQIDAYVRFGKGLKLHKDSLDLYVSGFLNTKTILTEGEYENKEKTLDAKIKSEITKNFKMNKYRNFKLKNADALAISGSTIQIS